MNIFIENFQNTLGGSNLHRSRVGDKHPESNQSDTVSSSARERLFLRILLNHVRWPKSFQDLLTVSGLRFHTFKASVQRMGLLEDDDSSRPCLLEAVATHMPSALRRLFVAILMYCEPTILRRLWDEFQSLMIEDYAQTSNNNIYVINLLLRNLNGLLSHHHR